MCIYPYVCHMNHLSLFDLIILTAPGEDYKYWSSSLRSFFRCSVNFPTLGLKSQFRTLISNTLSLLSPWCYKTRLISIQNTCSYKVTTRLWCNSWKPRVLNSSYWLGWMVFNLEYSEQRDILHEISKRKANWTGHILCRNCLLRQVIEGKIKGAIEVTGRRGRRRRKLLDDLKDGEGTHIWRRKLYIALCGGLALKEALDLSWGRLLYETLKSVHSQPYVAQLPVACED
jgi:hypothetical protein